MADARTDSEAEVPPPLPATPILAVCVLEMLGVLCVLQQDYLIALMLHVSATLLAIRETKRAKEAGEDNRLTLMFAVWVGVAGPFGALCSLLTLAFYRRYSRTRLSFMEWFASLYPEEITEEHLRLYDRIVSGLEDNSHQVPVEPFRDILSFGTLQQKQAALIKMTRYYNPAYAPLLRLALADKENAVRVHAATALAKLERDYMQNYLSLEADLATNPRSHHKLLVLAQFCMEYADSGIPDKSGEQAYHRKAIGYFEQLAKMDVSADIVVALGSLYRDTGQLAKSRACLEARMTDQYTPKPRIIAAYMETLYHMNAFKNMRELARKYAAFMQGESEAELFKQWAA